MNMMQKSDNLSKNKGFHFLEVVIVVSLIGILLGIAVFTYSHVEEKARQTQVKQEMNTVLSILNMWMQEQRMDGLFDEMDLFSCASNLRDNTNPLYPYLEDGFGEEIRIELIQLDEKKELLKVVYRTDDYQVIYDRGKELTVTKISELSEGLLEEENKK